MNDIKREIMESIDILLKKRLEKTTQSYYVNIISINNNNKCTVKLNGAEYIVPFYGNTPQVNKKYPIIVPQGNFSQAYVIG